MIIMRIDKNKNMKEQEEEMKVLEQRRWDNCITATKPTSSFQQPIGFVLLQLVSAAAATKSNIQK